MNPLRIAPSLLSCDFAHLAEEIARVESAGADWLHVDVMDGHFVPNLTIGPPVVERINAAARIPLDVHLMIEEPADFAADFVTAGAEVLTFHVETCATDDEVRETIAHFRAVGAPQVGIALCPDTPLERVRGVLGEVDLVLVMSVVPGFGGQKFLPGALDKVCDLRRGDGYSGLLEMDGGLNAETLPRCAAAGADVLVAGSAIFGSDDLACTIGEFREAATLARDAAAIGETSLDDSLG